MAVDHVWGRQQVIRAVRRELVGPSPAGMPLDLSRPVKFAEWKESSSPWHDSATGEEILKYQRPLGRYGIGVLYPIEMPVDEVDPEDEEELPDEDQLDPEESTFPKVSPAAATGTEADDDDFPLSRANDFRPSCMGLTFLVRPETVERMVARIEGGRYRPFLVEIGPDKKTWWVRSPVSFDCEFDVGLLRRGVHKLEPEVRSIDAEGLDIRVTAHCRPWKDGSLLVTVSIVNRTTLSRLHRQADLMSDAANRSSLFQVQMKVDVCCSDGSGAVLPYPAQEASLHYRDSEEESFDLLYRKSRTFAIGHGCAADWEGGRSGDGVRWVGTEALPSYETPSITPDIEEGGKRINISMARLADQDRVAEPLEECRELIQRYRWWIKERSKEAEKLSQGHLMTARRHIEECKRAADRMEEGLRLLEEDEQVAEAFRLANHAVLLQQLRTRTTHRPIGLDPAGSRFVFDEPFSQLAWEDEPERGRWRPFQIAFVLAAIPSVVYPDHRDRTQVELIWFPTGGGKTEAYLGLSAFSMFLRRLRCPQDIGTDVIMRYTLRLLTTQQFLRASALICAMEYLRQDRPDLLGETRFTIGIWLGRAATPNSRDQAIKSLKALRSNNRADNPFLLLRCPWCSAQMGPVYSRRKRNVRNQRVAGYEQEGNSVVFRCPDNTCDFYESTLPICVIDQDIYSDPPSMVIGTVDKFAQLTWQPMARAIFGIDQDGNRSWSPPSLIIQDELHLISGPLGSMVGLFESLIEALCTERGPQAGIRPKIISSTATIRRYEDQVLSLYGRNRVALFPPPGLDAEDSFFGRYDRYQDGTLRPGRIYLGVYGRGLGSAQIAQVRSLAALLQAAADLPEELRDPWWTLVAFFNSLRELGSTFSLAHSNIPDYLETLRRRYGHDTDQKRRIRFLKELTGRIPQDQVPKAIEELSRPSGSGAVDLCLASNIIEVGIDIERLSLLAVMGQPKSTSQYIQVTGRVGRRWRERPGLVVTIFHPSRPRDRSHFERFRSYHERLYAQVEPTSVTPFAPPVLSRALHGVLCGFVRQVGPDDIQPWPVPHALIKEAGEVLLKRVGLADPVETDRVKSLLDQRLREWEMWERTHWYSFPRRVESEKPLLRRSGENPSPEDKWRTWQTPTSLRHVDAECRLKVTDAYTQED